MIPSPAPAPFAWLPAIIPPGQVTEIRVVKPWPLSGYFDDLDKLQAAVAGIRDAEAVYFVPNPVQPELLSRSKNRIAQRPKATTSDREIVRRHWLLVDVDPQRPAGISATESEHAKAQELAATIHAAMRARGWPEALVADSGNGAQLMWRIDHAVDDSGLISRCLRALSLQFDSGCCGVDVRTCNPSRIWKLYGTWARKGDNTPDRPHRQSAALSWPATFEFVTDAQLEALAAAIVTPPRVRGKPLPSFDLDAWVARNLPDAIGPRDWQQGRRWVLPICPWNGDHRNRSAYVAQHASGAISAGCHHNGCAGRDWADLRDMLEPRKRGELRVIRSPEPPPDDVPHAAEVADGQQERPEWESSLSYRITKGGMEIEKTPANLAVILARSDDWAGCLVYDVLARKVRWDRRPPTLAGWESPSGELRDEHATYVAAVARSQHGVKWSTDQVREAIHAAASQRYHDPIAEYLRGLTWDGTPRINAWLEDYMGCVDAGPVGRWWLISAVARALKPGCQADYVLVLEGPQGLGKTEALRTLSRGWYQGTLGDISTQRGAESLVGAWIVEIGELDAIRGKAESQVKNFISQTGDRYRPAYGHYVEDFPRRCVFSGSTNEQHYGQDATGQRRLWPVRVGEIDLPGIKRDCDQLWAEAAHEYRDGAVWWPPTTEDRQILAEIVADRQVEDPWDAPIAGALRSDLAGRTIPELLSGPLDVPRERQDQRMARRVGDCLRRLGAACEREVRGGVRVRVYRMQ